MYKIIYAVFTFMFFFVSCDNDPSNDSPKPSVKYVYPESQTVMPINHKIIVNFDERVGITSFKANTKITKVDGTVIEYTTDNASGRSYRTFVLEPSEDLDANTQYKILISGELKSSQQVTMDKDLEFTFTTGSTKDTVPPLEDSHDLKKDIMKLYFNEHLNPLDVTKYTIELRKQNSESNIDSIIEYEFENRCVIIYPQEQLKVGIEYKYEIHYGGSIQGLNIEDLGKNILSPGAITSISF